MALSGIGLDPLGHPPRQGEVDAIGLATQRLSGDRIGAHPEQVEQVLLGDLRTRLDPPAIVEGGQAGAEEHAGRGSRLGVVAGQVRRRVPTAPSPVATDSIR